MTKCTICGNAFDSLFDVESDLSKRCQFCTGIEDLTTNEMLILSAWQKFEKAEFETFTTDQITNLAGITTEIFTKSMPNLMTRDYVFESPITDFEGNLVCWGYELTDNGHNCLSLHPNMRKAS